MTTTVNSAAVTTTIDVTLVPAVAPGAKIDITRNQAARDAIELLKDAREREKQAKKDVEDAKAVIDALTGKQEKVELFMNVRLGKKLMQIVLAKTTSLRPHRHNDMAILRDNFPDAYDASLIETWSPNIQVL